MELGEIAAPTSTGPQEDVVRLRVEANEGAVLQMRIDGHVASMEGLEGQFVSGKMIAYHILNQDITIRGDIQGLEFPDQNINDGGASIVELDVKQCLRLQRLVCNAHGLTSVDLTACASLEALELVDNELTRVDVTHCPQLRTLSLVGNPIGIIDLNYNPLLENLWISACKLHTLDVSNCPALQSLWCETNQLQSLDVSNCPKLQELSCGENQLQSLDVSGCPALQELYCYENSLQHLDVSGCPKLQEIWCQGNQMDDSAMIALVESLPMNPERSGRRIHMDDRIPAAKSWAQLKGWEVASFQASSAEN